MAKQIKSRQIQARVDEEFGKKLDTYVDHEELVMADLIRLALEEYLVKHPSSKDIA